MNNHCSLFIVHSSLFILLWIYFGSPGTIAGGSAGRDGAVTLSVLSGRSGGRLGDDGIALLLLTGSIDGGAVGVTGAGVAGVVTAGDGVLITGSTLGTSGPDDFVAGGTSGAGVTGPGTNE